MMRFRGRSRSAGQGSSWEPAARTKQSMPGHTFESLEKVALAAPDPVQRHSGRQEFIENLINECV